MAEGAPNKGKNVEELEEEITCGVCQEHYTEPKVLLCLHYYCKKCILKLALRTPTNKPFPCPECRKETTLPEGGVEELKTAFFINRFKSKFSALERVHGKVQVKCEGCDSRDSSEAFCRQCATFICGECIKQHKRMKAFSCHEVVSLEDLKQGRAREIAAKEPPIKKCHVHEEPLIIYCFDCNSLICRDCTVITHRDHKFEFSKVAAPNTKKKLLEELDPLREVSVSLSHAIEEVLATKQEVEEQGRAVANSIQTSFDELHEILEKRKRILLGKSEGIVCMKIETLTVQEKNLSLANAGVQSIVDHTKRFVRHCSDNELMSMHTDILSQIKHEREEHMKTDRTLQPLEEADMGVEVKCAKSLQQLCQTHANITTLPIVAGTIASAPNNYINTFCESTLSLTAACRKMCNVKAHIKSVLNGSTVNCIVNETGACKYSIKYTPTVRGRHELIVSVDGLQVKGSPFLIFVSLPPVQLSKPIKIINDIKNAKSVCINSNNELLVCTQGVVKIEKERKINLLFKTEKLERLRAMATDSEGNIYCIDECTSRILKCDQDGRNVQVYTVQQVNGSGHWGVTVVGDEVMVCERGNKGTIMVYSKELKYVRRVEHSDMGECMDVSPDCYGNLYITDRTNSCIQVFSNKGAFLRSFGFKNKEKVLYDPTRLHVSNKHVFVCDPEYHNSCVFVYTTAGEYVTSFGQYGDKEGHFNVPCSICVDKDGFIFVADYANDRVQCF